MRLEAKIPVRRLFQKSRQDNAFLLWLNNSSNNDNTIIITRIIIMTDRLQTCPPKILPIPKSSCLTSHQKMEFISLFMNLSWPCDLSGQRQYMGSYTAPFPSLGLKSPDMFQICSLRALSLLHKSKYLEGKWGPASSQSLQQIQLRYLTYEWKHTSWVLWKAAGWVVLADTIWLRKITQLSPKSRESLYYEG